MTASELIAAVLRRLSIISEADAPTATQVAQHIETLNDMMAQWERDGIDVGYSKVESGTETVYTEPDATQAIKCGLVLLLAMEYDKPVTELMAAAYEDSRRVLVRNVTQPQPVTLEGVAPTANATFGE